MKAELTLLLILAIFSFSLLMSRASTYYASVGVSAQSRWRVCFVADFRKLISRSIESVLLYGTRKHLTLWYLTQIPKS